MSGGGSVATSRSGACGPGAVSGSFRPPPYSDQAVYTRLAHGGTASWERLFPQIRTVLAERLSGVAQDTLASFATTVLALDETPLDQGARTLPALRAVPDGDPRLSPGKLAGPFDIRRQQWHLAPFLPTAQQNEKVAARGLGETRAKGALILADLGYFGFAWFDWLTHQGHCWVSPLCADALHRPPSLLPERDHL